MRFFLRLMSNLARPRRQHQRAMRIRFYPKLPRLRGKSGPSAHAISPVPNYLFAAESSFNIESLSRAGKPTRVLLVAASFLPALGGLETHVYEVTKRMAKRGDLELTVLTTDRSGALPAKEEYEGFTVHRCRAYPRRRDYYFAPAIYYHISRGHYDLVHCQGIHTAVPLLAMIAVGESVFRM